MSWKKYNTWNYERPVVQMAFQMSVSGILQEDLLYIWHVYLITAFDSVTSWLIGRKQKS
jgi:hypothetical protein